MNNRDIYNSWVYLAIEISVFVYFDNRVYDRLGALEARLS
jgi:hypothetical protein